MNNTEDFCLEKRLEDLFEEVYMDTMADVQEIITRLFHNNKNIGGVHNETTKKEI